MQYKVKTGQVTVDLRGLTIPEVKLLKFLVGNVSQHTIDLEIGKGKLYISGFYDALYNAVRDAELRETIT